MQATVLIIDDEEEMCLSLQEILDSKGLQSKYTTNPEETEEILLTHPIDLILMDIRMPGIGGVDLLKKIRSGYRDIPVIMISGHASIENVIKCMRYGALNFYKKPLDIPTLIKEILDFISKRSAAVSVTDTDTVFQSDNSKMAQVYHVVKTAAPTPAPVIITGESGTGKERIAMSIHQMSNRHNAPFVKINCAAIPDNLLESELFGYEAGAFTDARKTKKGKFELAHGGSIFLDEIGDMSLNTQAKLLRVLQEQEFERLGGTEVIKTNVRIIAATNKDFKDLIRQGKFRSDLFYRISVINIELPALKDRKEDIPRLCEYFLEYYSSVYGKENRVLEPKVKKAFMIHDWPGNIRELKNAIERAVIFSQDKEISLSDLGSQYQNLTECLIENEDKSNIEDLYDCMSKKAIMDALQEAGGSRQKAAVILNIHRKTLYNRMKKYGISEG